MKQLRACLTTSVILTAATAAWADSTSVTDTVGVSVPDNDPSGLASQLTVSGLTGGITNVTVGLNISGGYNGDLYAYLVDPTGDFAVLLNRVGVGPGNSTGYSDSGFQITLDDLDGYSNVHYYQNESPTITSGVLTGTWASDGENVDPQGGSVGSAPVTANLTSTFGTDPNGTWTLFISDLSPGGVSLLNSWTLDVNTAAVPEPQTWALGALGLAVLGARLIKRRQ
jgi:subtilisin-like proprotein convertase family protein